MKKLLLGLSLLAIISCQTDTDDFKEPLTESKLLRNVFLDGQQLYNFEYYSDNKIQAQLTFSQGSISTVAYFEYSNDTVFKKLTGLFTSKSKSYLSGSNALTLLEFDADDNLLTYFVNTYESSNCGLSKTNKFTQFGDLYSVTEYDYIDSNCSYNSTNALFNGVEKSNYSILKDDKNNHRNSVNPWPQFSNNHNIIEYRLWNQNDNLVLSNSYNSVFVYDDDNYPIQETRTLLSGDIKVYSFEYY